MKIATTILGIALLLLATSCGDSSGSNLGSTSESAPGSFDTNPPPPAVSIDDGAVVDSSATNGGAGGAGAGGAQGGGASGGAGTGGAGGGAGQPVPEPTTMLLVGSGVAVAGWRQRRRRQSKAD